MGIDYCYGRKIPNYNQKKTWCMIVKEIRWEKLANVNAWKNEGVRSQEPDIN